MTIYTASKPTASNPHAPHCFLVTGKDRRGGVHRRYIRAAKAPLKAAKAAMPPGVIGLTFQLVTVRDLGMTELPA